MDKEQMQKFATELLSDKTKLEAKARSTFDRADVNKSGFVEKAELKKVMMAFVKEHKINENISEEEVEAKMKEFDISKDDKLNFEEFLGYFTKGIEKVSKGDFTKN